MANSRDTTVDILRFIAISGIILIHVNPPHIAICQLRNFDVPLMVFLSGVVFSFSNREIVGVKAFLQYEWKRIKQILLPTWIFLLIYWAICFMLKGTIPSSETVISYLTLGTGWYIWIMRVFLLVALIAPFLPIVKNKIPITVTIPIMVVVLCLFEWLAPEEADNWWYYLFMTIPYMLIFGLGYWIKDITRQNQLLLIMLSALVYAVFALILYKQTGSYQDTQIFKYPPRLYYISYAIMCILILWQGRTYISLILQLIHLDNLCSFIGSHTMWVYFWHIVWLEFIYDPIFWKIKVGIIPGWLYAFILVYALAVLTTYIQIRVLRYLFSKKNNESLKRNIETLLMR